MSFKRNLLPPMKGGPTTGVDVEAVKGAVSRAGYWMWNNFNQVYTDEFAYGGALGGGIKAFQLDTGIKKKNDATLGIYDAPTHKKLLTVRVPAGAPHAGERAFNAYLIRQYESQVILSSSELAMARLWDICDLLVSREPDVEYTMDRPVEEILWDAPRFPIEFDCSGSTIAIAKWAGFTRSPDPIYGYTGYGYTGSLLQGGFAIARSQITSLVRNHLVLAFWHGRRTDHVAIVKSETKVFSHGEDAGPVWHPSIDYRGAPFSIRAYNPH